MIENSESGDIPVPESESVPSVVPGEEPEQSTATETGGSTSPKVTFRGNSYDLASVVGVTIGGMTLLTCATCNLGYYCLPVIPIILGIIGLVAAKDSVDPDRTTLLSWLSIGSGTLILLLIFLFIALYIALIIVAVMAENGGF